ncbi:MAG: hypothetical protein IJ880_13670 [Bacilli bacterium]|nr:hypothetical protein [Bacilli bacterium]
MLKKTVKYEDFDGNTREETLYFFISKTELTEMELKTPGGFANKLESISKSTNGGEIMDVFKDIILTAYGEKSEDGRAFIKKKNGVRLADEFEQSAAFDALFTELITNPDKASAFINGIMPKDLMAEANKLPSGNN